MKLENSNHGPGWVPLGDVEAVPLMTVCRYQFLDDLGFIRQPAEVFDAPEPFLDKYIEAVKERFKKAGWEGDGSIGILWLPPFVGIGVEDTWGSYLWHVKQSNNGMSWIGGDNDLLTLDRLHDQNEKWLGDTHKLTGIMFVNSLLLLQSSRSTLAEVREHVKELKPLSSPTGSAIAQKLLVVAQGDMIGALNDYLNGCYLEVLLEVFERGNVSNLPLGKFKANLNPMRYIPGAEEGVEADGDAGQWFTMKGLVSDIWRSYMFEAFDTRKGLLFKACEYVVDEGIQRELAKHVQLRNCIQHHAGAVTEDALKLAGTNKFILSTDNGTTVELKSGSRIVFSLTELGNFTKVLSQLAADFDEHTRKRIRRTTWVPKSFIEAKTPA